MTIQQAAGHLSTIGATITGSRYLFASKTTLYTVRFADGSEKELAASELQTYCKSL